MKKDLKDTTFIIPVRIESEDRLRNVITVCCFLLETFDTKIILKEIDQTSVFQERALPQIKEFVGDAIDNLTHIFEKSDPDDHVFYRMRYLNEMLDLCDTDIVANYDCDVLVPVSTYLQAQDMIQNQGYDVVYPYELGNWVKMCYVNDESVSEFLVNDGDFSIFDRNAQVYIAHSGHAQFFKRSSYIEGGMENENFQGSSPDDKERLHRFTTLGYKVGRVEDYVYHLEHSRGANSWPNSATGNPHMQGNQALWQRLEKMSADDMRQYYNTQPYLKKYNK